ncbi:hypothetical protein SeLEV6574_g07447 [Synchytrium endobioticum]|uniref:Uncharacterized protein n=1 Tax=Synchytrium endobioticum TaxID=286115 RepID=A0A507CL29_9FUNG|nr:hypothetical protein SeLEV6574_g07447 [Synchytrium endobioticum]
MFVATVAPQQMRAGVQHNISTSLKGRGEAPMSLIEKIIRAPLQPKFVIGALLFASIGYSAYYYLCPSRGRSKPSKQESPLPDTIPLLRGVSAVSAPGHQEVSTVQKECMPGCDPSAQTSSTTVVASTASVTSTTVEAATHINQESALIPNSSAIANKNAHSPVMNFEAWMQQGPSVIALDERNFYPEQPLEGSPSPRIFDWGFPLERDAKTGVKSCKADPKSVNEGITYGPSSPVAFLYKGLEEVSQDVQ